MCREALAPGGAGVGTVGAPLAHSAPYWMASGNMQKGRQPLHRSQTTQDAYPGQSKTQVILTRDRCF